MARRPRIPLAAYRYKILKNAVYERDKGKCQQCGCDTRFAPVKPGGIHSHEIHHVIPRCRGGRNEFSNLQTVCCECHRKLTAEMHAELAHERQWNPNYKTNDQRPEKRSRPARPKNNEKPMKIQQPKSDFEICPVGQHQATLCDVIDLGWEINDYQNVYKGVRPVLKLVFQTAKKDKDGRRFVIFDFPLGISFGKKSNFRTKRLNGILGSDTVADIEASGDFDQESLIGKNVLLSIIHVKSKDGSTTYPNIENLVTWPTDFGDPIKVEGYKRVEDGEKWVDPNPSAFEDITYDEAEVMLYEQGKLPAGQIPKLMQTEEVPLTDQPLPAEPKAMAPDPEQPLPATTHSPAQGEKERVKGNAKTEHEHQVKEAKAALIPPVMNRTQMKVIADGIKKEAMEYDVELEKVDYENFEEWRVASQAAIDAKGIEVFD